MKSCIVSKHIIMTASFSVRQERSYVVNFVIVLHQIWYTVRSESVSNCDSAPCEGPFLGWII